MVNVMIEGQNAEIAVEWEKCFLCKKDTSETLLSSEKLCAIFKKLAGFAKMMKFYLIVYGLNRSRKTTLNRPYKITTLNMIIVAQQTMVPICLHKR